MTVTKSLFKTKLGLAFYLFTKLKTNCQTIGLLPKQQFEKKAEVLKVAKERLESIL